MRGKHSAGRTQAVFAGMVLSTMAALLCFNLPAHATPAPLSLKLAPLQYREVIPLGKSKVGYVDVSNPTQSKLVLKTDVQAFRQIDSDGNLAFYPSEALRAGITTDLTEFELGPREAVRVKFSVDPNKLPRGGVYGALFFNTVPAKANENGTEVVASARIGSLLILDIGGGGTKDGHAAKIQLPFINVGDGIHGSFDYQNTATGSQPVAFNPALQLKVGYFGKPLKLTGPLVLPHSTRHIQIDKKGSFIGFIPVKILGTTSVTGRDSTIYVWAITGYWRYIAAILVAVFVIIGLRKRYNKRI